MAALASRVCTACGLCCNGVLFEIVRLGPGDSAEELAGLGMKFGRRKRDPYFKQPCGFLQDCSCSIYAARPGRCREFECRQIRLLAVGRATEEEAMSVIGEVKRKVATVEGIMERMGNNSADLPLSERCEEVRETGGEGGRSEEEIRELEGEMDALKALLDEGFRMGSGGDG